MFTDSSCKPQPRPPVLRFIAFSFLLAVPLSAQVAMSSQAPQRPPAALSAIRESDITRDLAFFAGDSLRGRESGTIDEMRASMWVADEMRKIGLEPLGDFGSWFQWWNMRRTRISSLSSSVTVDGRAMELWTEITPATNTAGDVTAPAVFLADPRDSSVDIHGRIAIAVLQAPPAAAIRTTTNTYEYNYTRPAITAMSNALTRRGAAAVILVADSVAEMAFDGVARIQARGSYDVIDGVPRFSRNPAGGAGRAAGAGAGGAPNAAVPVLLARQRTLEALRVSGRTLDIRLRAERFEYPSTNIIGVVRGTDPVLRDEYVLFSSHQDHDGIRYPVAGDSIWNGADDNGTTSVALLAIARAFRQQPGRRSALFVFHGAEERGLLGSRYHVAHPVVPLEKIAAVLNGDMLGRNHPDTAALLGSQPPHRNSAALVQMAIEANLATSRFVIDSLWDRPAHPEGWYFRSDHVPYAERKVPALFFSSNLHPDYHTPRDEPRNIDHAKLTRITQWMYMTGWIAANAAQRPAIDPGFILR